MTTEQDEIETGTPPPKRAPLDPDRLLGSQEGGSESSTTCMICMEEWTIGSEHRVCCLKCGHLFGRSCIERWIKEKGSGAKCPNCNKTAKKVDLRDLWCKTIKAHDRTELQELKDLLDNERKLRNTDSAFIFNQNLKLDLLTRELDKLKKAVIERDAKIDKLEKIMHRCNQMRAQKLANGNESGLDQGEWDLRQELDDASITIDYVEPRELKGQFHFKQNVESSATGGCRSFALCPTSRIILVAQPCPRAAGNVFVGFGLRKYSILDTNTREFIPLHSKIITSIQLKPHGDLILTSSVDKQVKLTSINNKTCVQSYQSQFQPTNVAWSVHRDQQFYVASSNCFVTLYDIRNTSEHIHQTSQKVANTRPLSIAATGGPESLNGLLVNDSLGCRFLEISAESDYESDTIDQSMEHLTSYQLPFEGLMGAVDFDKRSNLALITTRRTNMNQNSAHNLVKLKKVETETGVCKVECERVRTFMGGQSGELFSQSRILTHPTLSDSVLVCACDENARGLKLWDSSDHTEYQTLRTDLFIRDVIMYSPENSNQHVLYTLSERGLSIYSWDFV